MLVVVPTQPSCYIVCIGSKMPPNALEYHGVYLTPDFPGLLPQELFFFIAHLAHLALTASIAIFADPHPDESLLSPAHLETLLMFSLSKLSLLPEHFLNYISQYFSQYHLASWDSLTQALYEVLSLGNRKTSNNNSNTALSSQNVVQKNCKPSTERLGKNMRIPIHIYFHLNMRKTHC